MSGKICDEGKRVNQAGVRFMRKLLWEKRATKREGRGGGRVGTKWTTERQTRGE